MSEAKILIVDDRQENLFVLEALLDEPNVQLIKAESGNEALAKVLDHDFALILLDVQMPEMDGYEVAELLQGNTLTKHIPIIFITAKYKEKASIFKGYNTGAVDYLFKPLEPNVLKSKVSVFLEMYRQKKELENKTLELDRKLLELKDLKNQLEETNKKLTLLSRLDGLTGLLNRRSFDEVFAEEWHRGVRHNQEISALLIDIDYFKAYNDTYGHILGDEVLKKVAEELANGARRYVDKVARYGGEEFVIILPGTNLHGAELMAEKLRKNIYDLGIDHKGSAADNRLTISVGVASTLPKVNMNPLHLIKAADSKLYEAKSKGRNCWCSQYFFVDSEGVREGVEEVSSTLLADKSES